MLLFFKNFKFNKSLLKILTNILTGVNTKKKTIDITIGAINLPSNSPNLIHNLFKGSNHEGFITEVNRNIIAKVLQIEIYG